MYIGESRATLLKAPSIEIERYFNRFERAGAENVRPRRLIIKTPNGFLSSTAGIIFS